MPCDRPYPIDCGGLWWTVLAGGARSLMCPCDHAVRRDGVVAYYSTITAVFCDGRSLMLRCILTCFR
jgi:hypothetical protein